MTCNCRCIPTPASILKDDERDVFKEIIPGSFNTWDDTPNTGTVELVMWQILWQFYRYRGIGNCDVDYWVSCMRDRYYQISSVYKLKFKAHDEWIAANMGSDPVDLSDGETHYTMKTENEDTPDNPQGNTVYLSDRNTVKYDGKTYGGLSSETVSRFIDAVPDLAQQFADEFRKLFYFGV